MATATKTKPKARGTASKGKQTKRTSANGKAKSSVKEPKVKLKPKPKSSQNGNGKVGQQRSGQGGLRTIGVIMAGLVAVALIAAGVVVTLKFVGDDDGKGGTAPQGQELGKNSPALNSPLAEQANTPANRAAARRYLARQGFSPGDYCFTICVKHVVDRGANAVAESELLTNEDVRQWLNSDSPRAQAARARVKRVLSAEAYTSFLSGADHVRVQFREPIAYAQNSAYVDGQVVLTTSGRAVAAGDILFVFVSETKSGGRRVSSDGNVRGDCGNPHAVPTAVGKPGERVRAPSGEGVGPQVRQPQPGPSGEKPKTDTPENTPGPTGTGKPQPESEREPAGTKPGNEPPPPGGQTTFTPPVQDAPQGPAGDGGQTGCVPCP